jgi:hypothetical protein
MDASQFKDCLSPDAAQFAILENPEWEGFGDQTPTFLLIPYSLSNHRAIARQLPAQQRAIAPNDQGDNLPSGST